MDLQCCRFFMLSFSLFVCSEEFLVLRLQRYLKNSIPRAMKFRETVGVGTQRAPPLPMAIADQRGVPAGGGIISIGIRVIVQFVDGKWRFLFPRP